MKSLCVWGVRDRMGGEGARAEEDGASCFYCISMNLSREEGGDDWLLVWREGACAYGVGIFLCVPVCTPAPICLCEYPWVERSKCAFFLAEPDDFDHSPRFPSILSYLHRPTRPSLPLWTGMQPCTAAALGGDCLSILPSKAYRLSILLSKVTRPTLFTRALYLPVKPPQ